MTNPDNVNDTSEENTLARLRATKTRYESELKNTGGRAGEKFAMINADYAQLKRLQRWSIDFGSHGEIPNDFLALARIVTNEDGSEEDLEREMRQEYGTDIDEPEWIEGLIETALAKFEEMEPKL